MHDDEVISIPDLVDEMDHFLIWQVDEVCIIGFGLIIGIVIGSPIIGFIVGVVFVRFYKRSRDGKPKGFFMHRLRDVGLLPDSQSKGNPIENFKNTFKKISKQGVLKEPQSSYQPALVDKYIQ
ncbi:type IV conjugative transfer system protein TraL [Vibrio mediterranei]|uniref:type IV conjugative transfer system protein TraL n=1 Tax=Vibrio mediterranei TaxID=689 RepID=UPI00406859C5